MDYYSFGMIMPERSYSATPEGYRYGFNGMEKDDEVSGEGNSHSTLYRQYDSRLGRWLSLDPAFKENASHSPFCAMDNSPVIFSDPNGDKVKFKRDKENVSRKEFREAKKSIKQDLRKNSASFNEMYTTMKKDKSKTVTYNIKMSEAGGDKISGETSEEANGNINIDLNIVGSPHQNQVLKTISHETGHGYRYQQRLQAKPPSMPGTYLLGNRSSQISKEYIEKYVEYKQKEEVLAMHIENIVVSELKNSGNEKFKEMTYRSSYLGMPVIKIKTSFSLTGPKKLYNIGFETHDVMVDGRSEKYYSGNTFDIKVEANRPGLKSKKMSF